MANENKKKNQTEVEAPVDPIAESLDLEREQSASGLIPGKVVEAKEEEAHLILTKSNITLVVPGVFRYHHDEKSLSVCKSKHAFHGEMAKNFGIRVGDVVICSNATEAILVVVPE